MFYLAQARVRFPPIADIQPISDARLMRCFYVLVHGRLNWRTSSAVADDPEAFRPAGFYCHRYVLASGVDEARDEALHRVRKNLEKQFGWMRESLAMLNLQADEVADAPVYKLLKPDNAGHTFYNED